MNTIEKASMDLAIKLLNEHKQKEQRRKKSESELISKIKKVYDALQTPHDEVICVTRFSPARTIIWAKTIKLDLSKVFPFVSTQYEAGHLHYKSKYSGIWERYYTTLGKDGYNQDVSYMDNWWKRGNEDLKINSFYENRVTECPFCGDELASKYKYDWGGDELSSANGVNWYWDERSDVKRENFYKTPKKYKRCQECKKTNLKQYLVKSGNEEMLEDIYPSILNQGVDYFMEKRYGKPQIDSHTPNDIEEFEDDIIEDTNYLPDYSGNVYLMRNNYTGRIKIGMTKNEPKFRESTLQSEDPDVELIFHRTVSKMRDTEFHLHFLFRDKRYRGEWFDLTGDDVKKAMTIIKRESI